MGVSSRWDQKYVVRSDESWEGVSNWKSNIIQGWDFGIKTISAW